MNFQQIFHWLFKKNEESLQRYITKIYIFFKCWKIEFLTLSFIFQFLHHIDREMIITYLVSSRRSIEIWRVCKIYERQGGAEPSVSFTNPPYFYRPSGTDQTSVLFRQGPWIVYAVTKKGQKLTQAAYTAEIFARKCDVTTCANDVINDDVKIKGRHDVMSLLKSITKPTFYPC